MSDVTNAESTARDVGPCIDAVGDWQRLYAQSPTPENLRGFMTAVQVYSKRIAEANEIFRDREESIARRHFQERVLEHVRDREQGSDDVARTMAAEDLVDDYRKLFPSHGVGIEEIHRRHSWREFNPDAKPWVVDGLMRGTGVTMLAADPKAGKSTFARCLAVAVAFGHPRFLGRAVTPGPVLFFELDEPEESFNEHYVQITPESGGALHHFDCYGGANLPAKDDARFDHVLKVARDLRPALIVIDTLFAFTLRAGKGESADYGVMHAMMTGYQSLARKADTQVLVLHHRAKGDSDRGRPSGLGSQALGGQVDVQVALSQSGDDRYIEAEGRLAGGGIPKSRLDFADGWVSIGDSKAVERVRNIEQELLDWMAGHGERMKTGDIVRKFGGKAAETGRALRSLGENGRLVCEREGRGILYRYPYS